MSADLKVTIGGDSSGLAGALKGAESHVAAFGSRLAGALSVGAIVAAINKMVSLGAETARTAQRVNLSTDAVQAFADMAQRAGIEADKMFAAVTKIQTAQIDALADSSSKAASNFNKLGIDVRGLNTEEIVVAFAVALSKAGDNAEALAAAIDIVGVRNARLLDTFQKIGKEGPDAIKKIAAAMGGELVDEAVIAELAATKLATEELGDWASGWGQRITGKVAADFLLFGRAMKGLFSGKSFDEAMRDAVAQDVFAGKPSRPGTSGIENAPRAVARAAADETADVDAYEKRMDALDDLDRKTNLARMRAAGMNWQADAQEFTDSLTDKGVKLEPGDADRINEAFRQMDALKSGPNKALMENAFSADPAADRLARIGALSGRAGPQDLAARSLSVQQQQLAELKKLSGKDGGLTLA